MNADQSTQEQSATPPTEAEGTPEVKAGDAAPEVKEGQPPEQRKPVQPRIDELTRARREAERERDYWREQAIGKKAQESAPQPPAKPTPEKFGSYDEYVEALADWKADQKIDARLKDRDERDSKRTAEQTRRQQWNERASKALEKIPDLDSVLAASQTEVAPHVYEAIYESELGPQVAYHLEKNPEIAERLNRLPASAAAREIGRIEADILRAETPATDKGDETTADAEVEAPPPPKRTKAPPPPTPVGSGRSTQTKLSDMGMDEYIATRAKQGARWAGR
jgi:hypothetical protein